MACCQNKAFADQSWPHTAIIRAKHRKHTNAWCNAQCAKKDDGHGIHSTTR